MKLGMVLFFASLGLSLFGAEYLARSLISEPRFADRFFFWSEPALVEHENNDIRYMPNATLREVAIFAGEVEYDRSHRTNNLGYLDDEDYFFAQSSSSTHRLLALGDSFAAGVGGFNWLGRVREQLRNDSKEPLNLYNFSVLGFGIDHFHRTLAANIEQVDPTAIVLLAISDDFHRMYWRPLSTDKEVRMCPEGETDQVCEKRRPFALVSSGEASIDTLLLKAQQLKPQLLEDLNLQEQEARESMGPLYYSRFARKLRDYFSHNPLFALAEAEQDISQVLKDYAYEENLKALKKIQEVSGSTPVYFVHLPERGEVENAAYRLPLEAPVRELGIKYFSALSRCQWSQDQFYEKDTHPNLLGYAAMAKCVEKYLQEELEL